MDRPLAQRRRPARRTVWPLASLFAHARLAAGMGAEAARCTKCNNPDVVELSWLWDLRPVMLGKVLELARR